MNTQRMGVHEKKPAVFMKAHCWRWRLVFGSPPPLEMKKPPAFGPAVSFVTQALSHLQAR